MVVKPLCFYCQPKYLQSLMCDTKRGLHTSCTVLPTSTQNTAQQSQDDHMHQFEMGPILNEPVALQCLQHSPLTEAFQRHMGGKEQSKARVSFLHGFCGARKGEWRRCASYIFTPPSCNLLNRSSTNTSSLWCHSYPLMFYSLIVAIF